MEIETPVLLPYAIEDSTAIFRISGGGGLNTPNPPSQYATGLRWRCRRRSVAVCSESKSIKHGSWFQHTNLTFQEVMFLTYDIVRRVPARRIKQEHHYGFNTLADWG